MTTECNGKLLEFHPLGQREVRSDFDGGAITSDAGGLLPGEVFLETYAEAPAEIVVDLDATDDPLYGQQEARFYHGHYGDYCYLLLYVFCSDALLDGRLRLL